jgi:hypothetical protein
MFNSNISGVLPEYCRNISNAELAGRNAGADAGPFRDYFRSLLLGLTLFKISF